MIAKIAESLLAMMLMMTALLGIKKFLKKKISARWQYRLDYIFLLILVMPFIPWMKNSAPETVTAVETVYSTTHSAMTGAVGQALNSFAVNRTATPVSLYAFVWGIGAAVAAAFILIGYVRLITISSRAKSVSGKVFDSCLNEMNINGKISVKQADVNSPMIFGLLRTTIIIPNISMEDSEMRHVILHELVHYKRGDIAVNALMCLLRIIYWFNPAVWLAFAVTGNDMEAACDEAVMEMTGDSLSYGLTLLKFAGKRTLSTVASDMGGSKKQIKIRIEAAAEFTKATTASRVRSMAVFSAVLALTLSCLPKVSVTAAARQRAERGPVSCDFLKSELEGFEGSFVIYDMNDDSYTVYNEENSLKRVSPDSTYKIISALSALESGTITPKESYIEWDGTTQPIAEWNGGQTLESAMKNSVNWYFEALDKADIEGLKATMETVGYGNCDFSGGADCWLESSLKISPFEQTDILKGLYLNEYGFRRENIDAVKNAMKLSNGLFGKTGTGMINGHETNGWFVGFAETPDNVYFFAMNIRGEDGANGSKAADMAIEILRNRGIIDYEN